jgi:hypothetical protein
VPVKECSHVVFVEEGLLVVLQVVAVVDVVE